MCPGHKPDKWMVSTGTSLNPAINIPRLCEQSRGLVLEPDSFHTWHYTAPLRAKCMAHHSSGDQTAQGVSNSTGLELVVFRETQQ